MFGSQHGQGFRQTHRVYVLLVLLGVILLMASRAASAAALGMLADNAADRIAVFNADSNQVHYELAAQPGQAVGDCAISSDEHIGITTSSSHLISFIDLSFASGENRAANRQVSISNLGVDMSLSPDDTFLVSAGGGALQQPLSVIDIQRQSEVSVASPFVDHTSVEFCDNGTLLVTTTHGRHYGSVPDNALYDAFLDDTGEIHLLGGRVSSGVQPNNSACAPGSKSGIMLDRMGGITSFMVPTMQVADHVSTRGDTGISAAFNGDGSKLYVRTSNTVEAFGFNPETGELTPEWVREVPVSSTFFGMDQIAMHPDDDAVYVDGGDALLILDPHDGAQSGLIQAGDATGVCFAGKGSRTESLGTGSSVAMAPAP